MLPILQVVINRLKANTNLNLANITFVCIQHLLFTTVDIIESLILFKVKPSNIHVMGKIYSSCPDVVKQLINLGVKYYPSSKPLKLGCSNEYFNADIIKMWDEISATIINTKSDTIIILDDGGKAIANFPKALSKHYKTFVVEQTSSSISHITKNHVSLPIINVAYSAAKRLL